MTRASLNAHSQRATLALRVLAEKDPCFASLSLFCNHRDRDDSFAPASTDGTTIFYGKAFEAWREPQKIAICAHEILHVAFGHIPRGKRLQRRLGRRYRPRLFNIVTDAIINETLKQSGYRVPKEGVFLCELLQFVFGNECTAEDALSKWTAESLYVLIDSYSDALPDPIIKLCACAEQRKEGSAPFAGKVCYDGKLVCPKCGEPDSATAEVAVYSYAASKGFKDDIDHSAVASPLSPQEERAEVEWQERALRALNAGKMAGRGIGALGHTLADLPKSTTPWETILRATVRKAVSRRRMISFSKPTRRWLAMDADAQIRELPPPAFEPGLHAINSVSRVAVGIDVSGSISDLLLEKFAAEIVAIGKRTGAEIHILVFDTRVISRTRMKHGNWKDQITKVDFARGGGTDFHDVLERAKELGPSIIVILTDLLGPMGEAPEFTPVLWACPNLDAPKPKFGKVLHLSS